MNNLLESAIAAHGGQERRKHLPSLRASLSVKGALWESHGMANLLKLTAPFQFASPDYKWEELGEWEENGERWRPLKVFFPDGIATHTKEQVAYFGHDGLLRRLEYAVDVLGGAKGLNYADGIS